MSVFIGLVIGLFWLGAFHNAPVVGALLGALCGWVYKLNAHIKTLETNQQDLMQALQSIQGHSGAGADTADDRGKRSRQYIRVLIWQEFSGQNFTQIFYSFLRI